MVSLIPQITQTLVITRTGAIAMGVIVTCESQRRSSSSRVVVVVVVVVVVAVVVRTPAAAPALRSSS